MEILQHDYLVTFLVNEWKTNKQQFVLRVMKEVFSLIFWHAQPLLWDNHRRAYAFACPLFKGRKART